MGFKDWIVNKASSLYGGSKNLVGNHWKEISFVSTVAVAGIFIAEGISSFYEGLPIFKGRVGEYRVEYREGFEGNYLLLEKGGVVAELYDSEDENSLNWNLNRTPIFSNDKLERVVLTGKSGESVEFDSSQDRNSIEGEAGVGIFDRFNGLYRDVRLEIREAKRAEYSKRVDSLSSNFE